MVDDINVTNNNLYLFIPNLIPCVVSQLLFNESTQIIYTISYDEDYTKIRLLSDMIGQVDMGSAQQVKSPEYLIRANQIQHSINAPNKYNNFAIFGNLDLREYYVEKEGLRYPRYSLLIYYEEKDYIEQYKNSKMFFKEYIGEPILNHFILYPDMKTKYSIGILDLGHQPDHISPKKTQMFQEYGASSEMLDCF